MFGLQITPPLIGPVVLVIVPRLFGPTAFFRGLLLLAGQITPVGVLVHGIPRHLVPADKFQILFLVLREITPPFVTDLNPTTLVPLRSMPSQIHQGNVDFGGQVLPFTQFVFHVLLRKLAFVVFMTTGIVTAITPGRRRRRIATIIIATGVAFLDDDHLFDFLRPRGTDEVGIDHKDRPVHDNNIITLILLGGLVKEFLIHHVSETTHGGRPTGSGGGVFRPMRTVGWDFLPPGPITPGNCVFILDDTIDVCPIRVDELDRIARVFTDGVRPGQGFATGKPVNGQPPGLIIDDREGTDFIAVVGHFPLSTPAGGPFLRLLFVVQVHPANTHCGTRKRTNQRTRFTTSLGSLERRREKGELQKLK